MLWWLAGISSIGRIEQPPRPHRCPICRPQVRHAESEGNVDHRAYSTLPDPRVPLTARGWQQARHRMGGSLHGCMCGRRASPSEPPAPRPITHRRPPALHRAAQAMTAGDRLRAYMDSAHGVPSAPRADRSAPRVDPSAPSASPYKLFFYTSPYLRSRQVGSPCRAVPGRRVPRRVPRRSV